MIQAKIVADSLAPNGDRLTTLEIVFPRYILAELNTHRLFSKNSASSRAIPFEKMVKQVQESPFIPYAWQEEHSGMQGNSYITDKQDVEHLKDMWLTGLEYAIQQSKALNNSETYVGKKGLTKQLCNRLLEPFMYHKVLISSTEWENFFNLRCPKYEFIVNTEPKHTETFKSWKEVCKRFKNVPELKEANTLKKLNLNKGQADIHMMFLAEAIYDAIQESTPTKLADGEWHIPFGDDMDIEALANIAPNELTGITMAKISIARCARLSYQILGDNPEINYEKDLALYEALSTSGHWSPFEHVARVMSNDEYHSRCKGKIKVDTVEEAIIIDNLGWCKNFKGFIQVRELIETKQF